MRIALPSVIDADLIASRDPAAPIATLAGETMGTRWSVKLAAPATVDIDRLGGAISDRLAGLVAEMSHWASESLLCRFNRAAAGSWTTLPPDFAQVVATGLRIAKASGDAFDPAIGHVVDLWGFGPVAASPPPSAKALAAARARSGWRHLTFDPAARRLRQPGGVALDLSGIAKGYAVDTVADLLAAHGCGHALIEIGGELAGRGVRPDGEPWWVDCETPPGASLQPLRIALHGLSVATSGNYRKGDHNLDPRTSHPAANGVASVGVIHANTMEADAWATALTVLGAEDGMQLAAREDLAVRMVVIAGDTAREFVSPALAGMLAG